MRTPLKPGDMCIDMSGTAIVFCISSEVVPDEDLDIVHYDSHAKINIRYTLLRCRRYTTVFRGEEEISRHWETSIATVFRSLASFSEWIMIGTFDG